MQNDHDNTCQRRHQTHITSHWILWILTLILFLATPDVTLAQSPSPLLFDHVTLEDGLPESTVLAMVQDDLGFVWMGTQGGLAKYDGYGFTVFNWDPEDPDSLSNNNVWDLQLTPDGALWIATQGGGLSRLDLRTHHFTTFRHDPSQPNSLSSDFVNVLELDADGALWVGTQAGLNRLDSATGRFARYLSTHDVRGLAFDPAGTLWVGTRSGLYAFHPDDGTVDAPLLADSYVNGLIRDQDGQLWAGASSGLYRMDPLAEAENSEAALVMDGYFGPALYQDAGGRIWAGSLNAGLAQIDPHAGLVTIFRHDPDDPASLSGDTMTMIFEDRAGTLWVGTWANNLNRYDPLQRKFNPREFVTTPLAMSLWQQDQTLWVGTFDSGLLGIDRETDQRTVYRHNEADPASLNDDAVFSLLGDGLGRLWVGTWAGLNLFDPATGDFASPTADDPLLSNATIWSMAQDRQGWLWLGSRSGLFRYHPQTGEITPFLHDPQDPTSLSDDTVATVYVDSIGEIWVGTENGLNRLNPTGEGFAHYDYAQAQPGALSAPSVTAIHEDSQGILWVGTWGGGLNRLDRETDTFVNFRQKDGLPVDVILGILEDDQGRLWLSTTKGIARFDPKTEEIQAYDLQDGLVADDFAEGSAFQRGPGELFFGTDGVVVFDPRTIRDNPTPPNVVLTDFRLFNQSAPVGPDSVLTQHPNFTAAIALDHDQSVFSFEFTALNFTNAAKNRYIYKMDGFDADWIQAGDRRFATYTNLDPGHYVFRARASNNDGVWGGEAEELAVVLTIRPPWWLTWWAYALYLLGSIGLILGYVGWRTRAQRRTLVAQRRELAWERRLRENLERMERIRDAERTRIAHELHDGLAQSLAGLRFRARTWKTLAETNPDVLPSEFDELGSILDESIEETRRSIYALRPLGLAENGIFPSLQGFVGDLRTQYGVTLHETYGGQSQPLPPELEHNLFRIAQELLTNAVRHGRAEQIWLTLQVSPAQAVLTVRDDGVGFDLDGQGDLTPAGHFGLRQVRERVDLLRGSLNLDSAPGAGTTVTATLPTTPPPTPWKEDPL